MADHPQLIPHRAKKTRAVTCLLLDAEMSTLDCPGDIQTTMRPSRSMRTQLMGIGIRPNDQPLLQLRSAGRGGVVAAASEGVTMDRQKTLAEVRAGGIECRPTLPL